MRQNRTNLVLGILLILIGGWLVVTRQVPTVQDWLDSNFTWPMWTIGAGLLVLLIGLITGAPGMAVPASIIAGIGGRTALDDVALGQGAAATVVCFGDGIVQIVGELPEQDLGVPQMVLCAELEMRLLDS